jgi:hypothetical protein
MPRKRASTTNGTAALIASSRRLQAEAARLRSESVEIRAAFAEVLARRTNEACSAWAVRSEVAQIIERARALIRQSRRILSEPQTSSETAV